MLSLRFFLLTISALFILQSQGQKINTPQVRMKLLDEYFECKACSLQRPKIEKSALNKLVASDSILSVAAEKIKKYFTSEGDHFILQLLTAKFPPRTIGYMAGAETGPPSARGFGTYVGLRSGSNKRGGVVFYEWKELTDFLTDSVLVFDTIKISAAGIPAENEQLLSSLEISYTIAGKMISRKIPFDSEKKEYTLTYNSIYAPGLSRLVSDSLLPALSARTNNEIVNIPGTFSVFFASDSEKNNIIVLYKEYQKLFPDWSFDEIADELYEKIRAKYKNALKSNFAEWLLKQN